MLDSEPGNPPADTTPNENGPTGTIPTEGPTETAATPPAKRTRRRAASRPAGPAVGAEETPAPPADAPAEPLAADAAPVEPAAEPAAVPAKKTARKTAAKRTTKKAAAKAAEAAPEIAPETAPDAPVTPAAVAEQPVEPPVKKPARKRATRKAAAPAAEVAPEPTSPDTTTPDAPTPDTSAAEPASPQPGGPAEITPEQVTPGEVEPQLAQTAGEQTPDAVAEQPAAPRPVRVTDPFAVPDIDVSALTARPAATSDVTADSEDEDGSDQDDDTADSNAEDAADDDDDDKDDDNSDDRAEGQGDGRRRRRRRGGRRRRRNGSDDDSEGSSDGSGGSSEAGSGDAGSDRGETTAKDDTQAAPGSAQDDTKDDADHDDESGTEGEGGSRRRRRRRRRRGESDNGDHAPDDPATEVVERVREPRESRSRSRGGRSSTNDTPTGIEGSTRMEAKRQRRREGREAGRRRAPILSEAEFLARRESVERKMIIRQRDDLAQIAVLEDGVLVEHYVDRESATSLIGNVYLGRVQNVLPSMEAAFIDIGRGRNAVLYAGEVDWESFGAQGGERKVERVLKSGQTILVQVSKDPVGAKGARLTNHVSIPGRYLVYAPNGHLSGISRKLPENERKRLKDILAGPVGDTASVIVRTAAEGASEEELVRDVNRLKAQWADIETKIKSGSAPQLLYAEPDLTIRIVRDLFTEDFSELIIQGNGSMADAYDAVEAYAAHVAPHLKDRIRKWDAEADGDLFGAYRLDEQIAKGLERKVFLPSGGSLIIDRTEAMTVIDVNTGKFTGSGGNLEATITSNNLEAAEEIVRQLRLRDLGGIIVIDFIDMVLPANRELLLRRLVECLGRDRTRHQVAEVTSLGLVQMTRKRIGTGLLEAFSTECPTCHGRGVELHDVPVDTQKQADGGARDDHGRRGGGRNDHRHDHKNDKTDRNDRTDKNEGGGRQDGRTEGGGRGSRRGRGRKDDQQHDQNGQQHDEPRDQTEPSAPVESAPVESAPVESAPVESASVESASVESAPIEQAQPAEQAQPVEQAPVEQAQPAERAQPDTTPGANGDQPSGDQPTGRTARRRSRGRATRPAGSPGSTPAPQPEPAAQPGSADA